MHEARTSILGQVWCRVAFASDRGREGSGAPTLIAPPSTILWPQRSSNRSGVRASQQAGQSGAVKSKLLQAVEAWFVLASTGPMTRHVSVMILGKRVWEECVVVLTGDGRAYGAARRNRELKEKAPQRLSRPPPKPGDGTRRASEPLQPVLQLLVGGAVLVEGDDVLHPVSLGLRLGVQEVGAGLNAFRRPQLSVDSEIDQARL